MNVLQKQNSTLLENVKEFFTCLMNSPGKCKGFSGFRGLKRVLWVVGWPTEKHWYASVLGFCGFFVGHGATHGKALIRLGFGAFYRVVGHSFFKLSEITHKCEIMAALRFNTWSGADLKCMTHIAHMTHIFKSYRLTPCQKDRSKTRKCFSENWRKDNLRYCWRPAPEIPRRV